VSFVVAVAWGLFTGGIHVARDLVAVASHCGLGNEFLRNDPQTDRQGCEGEESKVCCLVLTAGVTLP
jgi:hypothetical protein